MKKIAIDRVNNHWLESERCRIKQEIMLSWRVRGSLIPNPLCDWLDLVPVVSFSDAFCTCEYLLLFTLLSTRKCLFAAPECQSSAGYSNTSLIRTKSDTSQTKRHLNLNCARLNSNIRCYAYLVFFIHLLIKCMRRTSNTSVVFQVKIQPINQNKPILLSVCLALFIHNAQAWH